MRYRFLLFLGLLSFLLINTIHAQDCGCDVDVPVIYVDLSAATSDTVSYTLLQADAPNRDGECTNLNSATETNCIQFIVTLNPEIDIVSFSYSGAPAQTYFLDCTDEYGMKEPVCASGSAVMSFTYCKPGGNSGDYTITAIQEAEASGDIAVSDGCSAEISVKGLQEASVTWQTVYPGGVGAYDSYLSSTSGEDTITVTPGLTPPSYIDIRVTGNQDNVCSSSLTEDTVRVHFVSDKSVSIDPPGAAICADGNPATLTANITGGAPPYGYLWNTGEVTSSISVSSPGWYSVTVSDTTACPEIVDSVYVTEHMSEIAVDAGLDQSACIGGSAVTINASVDQALGGIWSGGNGTINPADTILGTDVTIDYLPTAAEELAGNVELILTSYGNGDCAADRDTMVITYFSTPVVDVGSDTLVCASVDSVSFSGNVSVGSTTGVWTTTGTGTFSPNDSTLANVSYIPSSADTANGFVDITLTSTNNAGCSPASGTFRLSFETVPTVEAGNYTPVCSNNSDFVLNASFTNAAGIDWSTAGSGGFISTSDPNTTYTPSAADVANDSVLINISTTGTVVCPAAQDSVYLTIHQLPILTLPADETICASENSYSISASLSGVTSTGGWTTSGNGTFTPDAQTLNADYKISSNDTASGSVTLTFETTNNGACPVVSDNFTLTFDKVPIVDAGTNKTGCSNNPDVLLDGTVINATGGYWVSNGTGTFSDSSDLNATYAPSVDDIIAGIVIFTLNSTGNGTCASKTDVTSEIIIPAPVVDAGLDDTICANSASINLSGTVTNGSGKGRWTTSGDGYFLPNDSSLTPQYIAGVNDTLNGSVNIYLTSIQNGYCLAVTDSLEITITNAPTVSIGADQVVCANNNIVPLSASYTVASGIEWSSFRGGGFASGITADNTDYVPGSIVGFDTIYIQTTGNGLCYPAYDTMVVEITAPPLVDAGAGQTVCFNNPDVNIAGTVAGGSTEGIWSTLGDGSFDDTTSLTTIYHLGASDTSEVKLVLTSINNGSCLPVTDTLVLNVLNTPFVEAGASQTVCANNPGLLLSGNVLYTTTFQWSTTGDGSFLPSDTVLNPQYLPGVADTTNGNVTLNLITVSDGYCFPEKDSLEITITNAPTVSTGADKVVCANNNIVPLSASYTVASGIEWSSLHGGVFASGITADVTDYDPGSTVGFDTIYIQTTGNGLCNPAYDTMVIEITVPPFVDAGVDQTVCFNNSNINIAGTVTGGSTEGVWSTLGDGSFDDTTSLATVYHLGASDTSLAMLVLTSINNGTCLPVTDTITIEVIQDPLVDAGLNQTICANNPNLFLDGSAWRADNIIWSTPGDGSFADDTLLVSSYTPGVNDTSLASITLTLTGSNTCATVSDNIIVSFSPAPFVYAGSDQLACNQQNSIVLNGTVAKGSSTGVWTHNGDGGVLDPASLNSEYYFGANDIISGSVTFTLTSTNNGGCLPVSDDLTLTIINAPLVDIGEDDTICFGSSVELTAHVEGGSGSGVWTTPDGTGIFLPSNTDTSVTYNPTLADEALGTMSFIYTTTNNGSCQPAYDTKKIFFTVTPTINAGTDQTICSNNPEVALFPSYSGDVVSWYWESSGTGVFVPTADTLNPIYYPSSDDTSASSVYLRFYADAACTSLKDSVRVSFYDAPQVEAGDDIYICEGTTSALVQGVVGGLSTTGIWSTLGDGSFDTNPENLNNTYSIGAADLSNKYVRLVLTSTNNSDCLPVTDTVEIYITTVPTIDAGIPQTICANDSALLQGMVVGGSGKGIWTTSGDGAFSPSDTSANANYIPGTNDELAGFAWLKYTTISSCLTISDSLELTVLQAPIANAGVNDTVCEGTASVILNGDVTLWAQPGLWTSSGDGSFNNPNILTPGYTFGVGDLASGKVNLFIESTNNGICNAARDTVEIVILKNASVNAGGNLSICDNDTLALNGVIIGGSGTGIWSTTGTGTFTFIDSLQSEYIPDVNDVAASPITIALTTTNNGGCPPASNNFLLTVLPSPAVDAGSDDTICYNNPVVSLSGNVLNAGGGEWSTLSLGNWSPNNTSLITDYEASLSELSSGYFPVFFTSTGNGICKAATDTLFVSVTEAPFVDAGTDKYICQGTNTVFVSGQVAGTSTKGRWSTMGTGTFMLSSDSLQTVYRMSSADTASGYVNLVLESRDNGMCNPVSDTMTVFITSVPTVNAGIDTTICSNNDTIQLSGIIEDGTAGTWNIISGDGIFIPSKDSLNARFVPGSISKSNGEVELMLIATASCVPVRDTVKITITPAPVVNAGDNVLLCSDAPSVSLSGQVSLGASTGQWSTLGTGSFGDINALETTYLPSDADTAAHGVKLILTSTLNGNCIAVQDTIELSFGEQPDATFFSEDTVCANENIVFIDASVAYTGGINTWRYFINNDTLSSQNANYQFTNAGPHKVLLEVVDDLGCADTTSRVVVVPPIPVADFSYADNCELYQVTFTNNSTNAVNWQWDFGNSSTSNLENPVSQVYPLKGTYQGKLIIEDIYGCFDSVQRDIVIYTTPQAGFSADQFCEGLPASFYDKSEIVGDTIQSWFWDFGDGATSNVQEPVHLFSSSDSSQIIQIVSTNHCSDTATLWVAPVPKPSFQALPAIGCTPLRIKFQQDTVEGANYQWYFGDGFSSRLQQPVHTFLNTTDSIVTFDVKLIVETQSGCIDSVINKITVYPNPVVDFELSDESVCSKDTIVFTNITLNGTSYKWDFGDGSPVVTDMDTEHSFTNNLTTDAYFSVKLIAESSLGCLDSTIKYVRVFPLPDPEILGPDTVCHEEPVTLTGPSGGSAYDWDYGTGSYESGGSTVKYSFTNTTSNAITYPVRLKYTSQEGCSSVALKDVSVFPSPQAEFSLNKEAGCSPYFMPQITNSSIGSVDHFWTFGDEVADTLINELQFNYNLTQKGNTPVNRLINLRAVNSVGCATTYQRSVTIYPEIQALFNADSIGCSPFDVKFENLTTNAKNTVWYFGDGNISTNTSPNHTYINFNDANAIFDVSLIVTSAYGCKDTLEEKSVLVHPSPEALFTLDNSAGCSPFNAEIFNASTGATDYFWNFGDGSTTDEKNLVLSHVYRNTSDNVDNRKINLVVINQYLCVDTVSEFVNIYPEVKAGFTADTIGCSPLVSKFVNYSEGARHYNWVFGDGNTSTGFSPVHAYTNLTQQPQYLSAKLITFSEYLCSDTAEQQIVVYNNPDATFTISDNAACAPYTIELKDSTSGAEKFYWDYGDGVTDVTDNFISTHLYDNDTQEPQIQDISLVVENKYNCVDTVSHTVTIYPKVKANFAPVEPGCSPLTIDFINLSDNVLTYDWSFGDGGVSGLKNPQHTFINQGVSDTTIVITLIAESHFNCSDTFWRELSVFASPDPEFIADPSFLELPNTTVNLTNITPGLWGYHWDFADGNTSNEGQPGSHTYDTYGDFKIVLNVTSLTQPQCKDTVSHTIRILPGMPVADYDSSFSGCAPLTASFINKSIGAGWFEWDFGDGGRSDDENPTYTFRYPGTYVVRLKAFSVHGSDEADKHKVEVYESPKAFFQIAPKIVTIPDPMITYNLTDNGTKYFWDFGDDTTSEDVEPEHYYNEEGTYTISLMAWSEHGCFDSIVKVNEVIVEPGCKFLFPNAFTPSDAPTGGKYDPDLPELTNDIFHPLFNNITDYHLEIYNRWGELIFVSDDITVGWDGSYQEKLVQQGVYIWKATGRCINGKLIQKQGTVTLLR